MTFVILTNSQDQDKIMQNTSPCCPLCSSLQTNVFLEQASVPVHQNLVFQVASDAANLQRGDIALAVCSVCGFVFNSAFDSSKLTYNQQYDNTQLASPYFQKYMNGLVDHLINDCQVRNAHIVEVGCGKGDFLRALVEADGSNNTGIGFDPTYIGPESDLSGRLHYQRRFYDETCIDIPADIIICRHVIEHIPQPVSLLRAIHKAIAKSPQTRLFFETPTVKWIFEHQVVWDVFYEHCSYFSVESLTTAFEMAGFSVESVSHVFDGQYLWLEASNHSPRQISKNAAYLPSLAYQFATCYQARLQNWRDIIHSMAQQQRLALWGAGAKGVTLANFVDPEREYLKCLIDINPSKQGKYLPGTGHPIISPAELMAYEIECALVLNPNYFNEIRRLLHVESSTIQLVNLGGAE